VTIPVAEPVPQDSPEQARRLPVGPYFVFLILVGGTIPWQSKSYFEGALDPIALAKAVLCLFALGCAVLIGFRRPTRELRAGPLILLLLYLACSVVGAWSTGYLIPSMIIVIRVLLLAVTVVLLSRVFEGSVLLGSLIAALGTFAIIGAVTGIGSLATKGRLAGGLPPLHPNELASTCAVIVLWCLWKVLAGQDTWFHLASIAVALGIMVATASRTPWIAMGVAALFLMFHARSIRVRNLVVGLAAMPIAWWLLSGTDLVRNLLFRGDEASNVTTLSNRTIAWHAALAPKSSAWLTWFGGGLQLKRINVPGQYWNQQILDSSWISALVQAGFIGLFICGALVLFSMVGTVRSPAQLRALPLALLSYLSLRGFLESGLFDASTAFLLFLTAALASPVPTSDRPNSEDATTDTPAPSAVSAP
jgi:hypothetical protein